MVDLSIIVISYNTRELTLRCLDSLRTYGDGVSAEVTVLDNASADGSADAISKHHPEVTLIRSEDNLGFARGNNVAARQATGRYLLLLNPDTEIKVGCLQAVLGTAESNPGYKIIGGRTYFANGELNYTSVYGRPTPWSVLCKGAGLSVLFRRSQWLNPESMGSWPRDTQRRVDLVTGCFLMIHRELWEQLEGFDEEFFMYGEDWDLCLRARALGHACGICPEARLIHHGGASERVRSDKMVRLFRANAQLYRKHWRPGTARFGVAMLDLWAWTRMSGTYLIKLARPAAASHHEVWRQIWSERRAWRSA